MSNRSSSGNSREVRSLYYYEGNNPTKDYTALIQSTHLIPHSNFLLASLSPERAEDSDALTAVSSQLEGSPMDTSSLASCTLEEAVGDTPATGSSEQPTAGNSTPGDAPSVVAEVQGRPDVSGESTQQPEDK